MKQSIFIDQVLANMKSYVSTLDWAILGKVRIVSEPCRALKRRVFDAEQCVSGSVAIPLGKDLRDHLEDEIERRAPRFNVVERCAIPQEWAGRTG